MLRHRIVMACIAAAAVLFQAAGFASQAWAQERRVALVVGANEYRHVTPLATAVNDARAVARRLGELGFEVVGPVLDPTRDQFIAALDRFEALLAGANLGLFFYAGHGVEVGGRNLLLPVDAPAATSERQLRANAIDAQEIVSGMLARTARAVVILDACRDNPLPRDPARGNQPIVGSTRGLEPMEGPRRDDGGSFVVLAAAPGAVAFDRLPGDDADPNGVFTRHLLRAMAQPARPLPALMTEVRDAVAGAARAANRTQIPEITDRMVGSGQVMLARGVVPPVPPVVAAPPSPMPQGPAPEALDLAFWQSIQNSRNVADFEAYLARFPNGTFAALARNRIAELRTSGPATTSPPSQPAPAPVPVQQAALPLPGAGSVRALTRDEIVVAQVLLGKLGFDTGGADGVVGPRSRAAMERFAIVALHPDQAEFDTANLDRLTAVEADFRRLTERRPLSPRGVAAASVQGAEARFQRGWAAERATPADVAEAFYWYGLAAREGEVRALNQLGLMLMRGQGTAADSMGASLLWRLAAARGDATAAFNLGLMLEHGIGIGRNLGWARFWYDLAAEAGHPDARAAAARVAR